MIDTTITYSKGFIVRSYYLTTPFDDTFMQNVLDLASEMESPIGAKNRFIRDEIHLRSAELN